MVTNYSESITFVLLALVTMGPLLLSVAFYTSTERKISSVIQRRWGPDCVGFYGSLQPIADAMKLLTKAKKIPNNAYRNVYVYAPMFGLTLAFSNLFVSHLGVNSVYLMNSKYSGLSSLVISSMGSYGMVFGGWASNSKYASLGSSRAMIQSVAYEIFLSVVLTLVFTMTSSLSSHEMTVFQNEVAPLWSFSPFLAMSFLLSNLSETNRMPFDLSEAEAELVAGYNVEYGGVYFLMYFLTEYLNSFFMSLFNVLLFYGGYCTSYSLSSSNFNQLFFYMKVTSMAVLLVLMRALLPRYRYDQSLSYGWKLMLPGLLISIPINVSLFLFSIS